MSEPKRYTPDWRIGGTSFIPTTREAKDGEYVMYEDYQKLKKENVSFLDPEINRLTENLKDLKEDRIRMHNATIEDIAVIARLRENIEKLIIAGDTMMQGFKYQRAVAYAGQEYAIETQSMKEWKQAKIKCTNE